MSTHAQIGFIRNGKIYTTYLHGDGYPEYAGRILKKHYTDPRKVQNLVAGLGKYGISYLGTELGKKHKFGRPPDDSYTGFYGRDRGENRSNLSVYSSITEFNRSLIDYDYTYLFDMDTKIWRSWKYRNEINPQQKTETRRDMVNRKLLENKLRKMIQEEIYLLEAMEGPEGWQIPTFNRGDTVIYQPKHSTLSGGWSRYIGQQGKVVKILAANFRDMGAKTYDVKMNDGKIIRCSGNDLQDAG